MTERPLQGIGVLVTRPREQASELSALIAEQGGEALSFPVMAIEPRDPVAIAGEIARLAPPDIAVFISRNAVAHGLRFAASALKAAVGPATAAAIEARGERVDIQPADGFDSESLLAEPALQDVAGKTIRIIRGDGGRELLGASLSERGANVHYLTVYQRVLPEISPQAGADIEAAWKAGRVRAITVMSVQTLQNLMQLLPAGCRQQLADVVLVTPSERVIKEALNYAPGSRSVLASGPRAAQMLDAIIASQTPGPAI